MKEAHYEEDGRCGYCYEAWPCTGSKGGLRSGYHAWRDDAERRRFQAEWLVAKGVTDHVNELLDKLGYTMFRVPEACSSTMVSMEMLTDLLERIDEYERQTN